MSARWRKGERAKLVLLTSGRIVPVTLREKAGPGKWIVDDDEGGSWRTHESFLKKTDGPQSSQESKA